MTQRWRIRVSGKPKRQPDIALLVRAVIALGEQLAKEREAAQDGQLPESPEEQP
jgi:hypothetical protein